MKFYIINLLIILTSLILFKYVNKKIGISFFILGILIVYLALNNNQINDNYNQINYNNNVKNQINDDLYKLSPSKDTLKILPNIYFINLDHRTDRLEYFQKEMKKIKYPNDKIHRVSGIRNTENGHKGCLESHIKALKTALKTNEKCSFIAEDDLMFLNESKTTLECIEDYIKQDNWNVLLLDCGGIKECGKLTDEKKKRGFSNKNYNPGCGVSTGYIIKREYIPILLSVWEPLVGIDNWKDSFHACDQSWKVLQDEKWIVIAPRLITQTTTFSDTENSKHNVTIKDNWIRSPDNIPIELESSQRKMLNMLKIFDNISKKHNFKYWAIACTLLGVVRHNGWIPWDGDMDIGMLKSDYMKFSNIIRKELPKNLWLQYIDNDPTYTEKRVAKIRDLYSCYTEYSENNKQTHNGLQIDIFLYTEEKDILRSNFSQDFNADLYKKDIFPLKSGIFEYFEVPIPFNSDKILKNQYGDYMTLPPLSKRYPHEGETNTYKTCSHHLSLYPDLYVKYKTEISYMKAPRVCWVFWFGSENPSPIRKKLIKNMENKIGVKVILITCNNIHNYLKYPIHPSVPYLSGIHKSDYFRTYFLLHYGGAYYDIKNINEDFSVYFDILDNDPYTTVIGSQETKDGVAHPPNMEYRKLWFPFLICNGGFIAKPYTNYMKELQEKQHEVLDKHYQKLKNRSELDISPPLREPATWDNYPLRWGELFGELHTEIAMKYRKNTKKIMKPINTKNYGAEESAPKKVKSVVKRSKLQKWIDEDFLKRFTYKIFNDT